MTDDEITAALRRNLQVEVSFCPERVAEGYERMRADSRSFAVQLTI